MTTPGKEAIKWNQGAPSNVTVTTKTLSKPGVQPAILQLTTKVISAQFKGTTSVAKAKGTAVNGACISSGLGTFTVTGSGSSTFKWPFGTEHCFGEGPTRGWGPFRAPYRWLSPRDPSSTNDLTGGSPTEGIHMRKFAGLLFAMSLLIPVAMWAAPPAGSAAATPVCKTFRGTLVYSPALPKLTSSSKVNATVVTAGKIGGCVGGGVTSAITASKSKYLGNCSTLVGAKPGSSTSGSETIIWSNGKSSTAATTLTTLNAISTKGAHIKVHGKITKGQFPGLTFTITINATAPAGSCVSKGLSTINFVNITPFTK